MGDFYVTDWGNQTDRIIYRETHHALARSEIDTSEFYFR
jgi:hypothetical protein